MLQLLIKTVIKVITYDDFGGFKSYIFAAGIIDLSQMPLGPFAISYGTGSEVLCLNNFKCAFHSICMNLFVFMFLGALMNEKVNDLL